MLKIVIGLVGVIIIGGALWLGGMQYSESSSSVQAVIKPMQPPQKTVNSIAAITQQSTSNMASVAAKPLAVVKDRSNVSLATVVSDLDVNKPENMPPTLEDVQHTIEQKENRLNAALGAEIVDAEWAPSAQDSLLSTIQSDQELQEIDVSAIDCRSTLCRLEFTATSIEANAKFSELIGKITLLVPWQNSGYFEINTENPQYQTATFYVSREGYSLPTN